ncbi:MAG UNVERIFIED_CONTAM: hypothetical protein LVQ98_08445 [Rickettsiaceae bacterium]
MLLLILSFNTCKIIQKTKYNYKQILHLTIIILSLGCISTKALASSIALYSTTTNRICCLSYE